MIPRSLSIALLSGVLLAGPLIGPAAAVPNWDPVWVAVDDTAAYDVTDAQALGVDSSSHRVQVTGNTRRSGHEAGEIVTGTYAADGRLLRTRTVLNANAVDIAVDSESGASYVTGTTDDDFYTASPVTVAYDRAGKTLWTQNPATSNGYAQSIVLDSLRDRVYVAVQSVPDDRPILVAYRQSTGAFLWSRAETSGSGARVQVAVDGSSGLVGLAYDGTEGSADGSIHLQLATYTSTGQRRWHVQYDSPAKYNDLFRDVVAGDGGFYLLGEGRTLASTTGDIVVAAYASNGSLRWATSYDGPAGRSDSGAELALDPASGTLVVTGTQNYVNDAGRAVQQSVTLAYATADGDLRWLTPGLNGYGVAVTVDPVRHVVYATLSVEGSKPRQPLGWANVAYDLGSGELLREAVVPLEEEQGASPHDIGVDLTTGQVYVLAGIDRINDPNLNRQDFATISYPPAR